MLPCIKPSPSAISAALEKWRDTVRDNAADIQALIVDHVATGSPLGELERLIEAPPGSLTAFISSDHERIKAVSAAMVIGEANLKDAINAEAMSIAFVDPADVLDNDGEMRPLQSIPLRARRAIKKIEVQDGQDSDGNAWKRTKIEFYDKVKALTMLGSDRGMFAERHNVDVNVRTIEQMLASTWAEREAQRAIAAGKAGNDTASHDSSTPATPLADQDQNVLSCEFSLEGGEGSASGTPPAGVRDSSHESPPSPSDFLKISDSPGDAGNILADDAPKQDWPAKDVGVDDGGDVDPWIEGEL